MSVRTNGSSALIREQLPSWSWPRPHSLSARLMPQAADTAITTPMLSMLRYARRNEHRHRTSVWAPFTDVHVSRRGTYVRAPFVDLFVPR